MKNNAVLLRKAKLHLRSAQNKYDRFDKSMAICKKVLSLDSIKQSRTVLLYVNYRSEVETQCLFDGLKNKNKIVTLPFTLVKDKKLIAVEVTDLKKDLAPGYCGIPEPKLTIHKKRKIEPSTIDVVIVPGSVFDEKCGRMGYGGGFYDRFLSTEAPRAKRIGICYDLQLVNNAPLKKHDELMDFVITEKKVIER